MAVTPSPAGFLANGLLLHVSRQSRLSDNDKGDNEMMIPGAVQNLLAVTLRLRKSPEKLSKETVDEDSETIHRLKWGPLPPNEVGRIAQHVKKGKGRKKERAGLFQLCPCSNMCYIETSFTIEHWLENP